MKEQLQKLMVKLDKLSAELREVSEEVSRLIEDERPVVEPQTGTQQDASGEHCVLRRDARDYTQPTLVGQHHGGFVNSPAPKLNGQDHRDAYNQLERPSKELGGYTHLQHKGYEGGMP